MLDSDIYTTLQALLPQEIIFVESYLTSDPVPLEDYVTFTTLNVSPVGLSQNRGKSSTDVNVDVAYDIERVYRIQIDFYGPNAAQNSRVFQQELEVALKEKHLQGFRLKRMEEIQNLTEFSENKKFIFRYGFTIELYIVDSIEKKKVWLTNAEISVVRAGNN